MGHQALRDPFTRDRHARFRAIHQFFKWAEEKGEIDASPMLRMRAPAIPDRPVPVISSDDLARLLKSVSGKTYLDIRDNAVIRLWVDTGMRRSELTKLKVEDVDLKERVAYVVGKGSRPRYCPFGMKQPPRWTATCEREDGTSWPTGRKCGWGRGRKARSCGTGCGRCSSVGVRSLACHTFTRTSSGTCSPTTGCPTVARRAT